MRMFMVLALCLLVLGVGQVEAGLLDKVTPGTRTEFGLERDVDLENSSTSGEMMINWYLATLDVAVNDWLTVTPMIGACNAKFETNQYFGIVGNIEAESEAGLALGIRGDALVHTVNVEDEKLALVNGIEVHLIGEYLYGNPELDNVELGALTIDNPIRNDIYLHQWEIGARVQKQFGVVTPYLGICYSDLTGEYDFNLSMINLNEDIESEDNVGLRLGVEAQPLDNFSISVDGKILDQYAIGMAGKVRF